MATAGWDKSIKLWNAVTNELLHRLSGHGREVTGLAFSPDGPRLVSCGWDQAIRLWDPAAGAAIESFGFRGDAPLSGLQPMTNNSQREPDVPAREDSSSVRRASEKSRPVVVLATGGGDKAVRLWNANTGEHLAVFQGHEGDINAIAFSPRH